MTLFNVTGGKNNAYVINPSSVEESQYIEALKKKLHPAKYSRIVKTAEEAVDSIVTHGRGKLIWTKAGALFGHGSMQPKKRVDHLWDGVVEAVGDGKECLIAVGCLLRWVIAQRPETWLLWVEETDDIDPDTGNKIKVSQYWIDHSFAPEKPRTFKSSVDALKAQWGARA